MDKEKLEQLFFRFPKLPGFISAGVVTLKAARMILDIDRWLMYEIFTELLQIGAVKGAGSVSWRATAELVEYLKDREETDGITRW